LKIENYDFIAAIGDVHGCLDETKLLVERCLGKLDELEGNGILLFLGDYVDRGPKSYETANYVRSLVEEGKALAIMGNHENMAIEGFRLGYRMYDPKYVTDREQIEWFRTLPLFYETDLHFFVHAGIDPQYPLDDQIENDLIWVRHKFLLSDDKHPKYIVHGHTPTNAWEDGKIFPEVKHNRCNLDTGGVFGGNFSAAIFDVTKELPIWLVSIPSLK